MPLEESLGGLRAAQADLRSRFDDFRRALSRRDATAYRFAIQDFHSWLRRWSEAQEKALLPAVLRAGIPNRDPARELRLEWVQLRELTRHLASQIEARAPIAEIEGLVANLERRLTAHEKGLFETYYPAAAGALARGEWEALSAASPL